MRRLVLFLASVASALAQPESPAPFPPPAAAARQPVQLNVRSSILAEDRRILVRLPRHYDLDPAARFPVLYKFDGDNGLDRYDDAIDVLSSAGLMPDLIVVAIPNGRGMRNRDLTPATLHQEGNEDGSMGTGELGRGDRFLDFVQQELIPHIDKQYRTTPERILAGHSRGALLVLQSLLSKPDLFQARFVFSAPLMRDEQRMLADTRKFLAAHPTHRSFLYCNWGEAENEGMNKSYAAMKALLTDSAPSGLRWTIERARAADHQQTPLLALPAALHRYFAGRR
jgi:predicted alpha/beta superfamily hydrolase